MEIKIDLHRNNTVSLSKQIYQSIADRISSGLLAKGARLPSVRSLSKTLNVSMVTVSKAYAMLADDHIISTIQGKGTYVQSDKLTNRKDHDTDLTSFNWQLYIPDHLPRAQFWWQNISLAATSQLWLSASSVHPSLLPEHLISKHISSFILKTPGILSEYGPVQGDLEFRSAVADYLISNGISISKNEIIITNGSQQAINLVARTFIGAGDIVVMEAPTYTAAIDVFRWQGATILSVPVDKDGMRIDLLLRLCNTYSPKLIYTIPTYHNPTGTVMSMQRRKELIEIAKEFNCLIVEDDPWREISFEKNPLPPLKSMDTDGHIIYIKGFSKFLSPGCRIGTLAASGTILNRLIAAKSNSDLGSPLLTQKALLPFVQWDFMKKHLKNMNHILYNRRNLILKLLKKYMPATVEWNSPMGGPNIWLTLPSWLSAESLVFEAQNDNIAFLTGSTCYSSEPEFNHIRLSFSSLDQEQLENGIITLSKIVSSFIDKKNAEEYPIV
ncbi:MocR-like pyridoxine biosynthesis transcription factor PdxR [Fusibacter bizertensis]